MSIFETNPPMDPRTQECLGFYLYGAGYFARDDNTLGVLRGERNTRHFCLGECPLRQECEDKHEERVRELLPEDCERFDRMMHDARSRGIPPTLAAVKLGERGLDPYMRIALDNFKRGHGDRGRSAGLLAPR